MPNGNVLGEISLQKTVSGRGILDSYTNKSTF